MELAMTGDSVQLSGVCQDYRQQQRLPRFSDREEQQIQLINHRHKLSDMFLRHACIPADIAGRR